MQMTNNTILITGGGSGIGAGLAKAFHDLGNQVIITGRRQNKLDEVTSANRGMASFTVDMESAESIRAFASAVVKKFPALNVVIHNAGVMTMEDLKQGNTLAAAEATIATNLLGPIRLTEALLPTLLKQPAATIMTVTSGLAFVPLALTPTYCATKAAMHSWSQSLRYQLKDTKVQVIELAPPYVQTTLTGEQQAMDPRAMPLDEFIAETMSLFKENPDATEVLVKRVHPLRFAEQPGTEKYQEFFLGLNDAWAASAADRK